MLTRFSTYETRRFFPAIVFQIIWLAAFLIIFSRRPDAILNAQFFAEDGKLWYADAYQFGLRCLLMPDRAGGYFRTVSHLVALVSLAFPFALAPLVMNLCAMVFQILPVSVFLSSRFSNVSLFKRLVVSFLYLALPNTNEVNANASTIQWHLALLAFLVLLARPTNDWEWRIFDGVTLVLISLDSPIGILLVPVAAAVWQVRRNRESVVSVGLLVPGALMQAITLLVLHSRNPASNGSSLSRLISILGRQVFVSSLLGREGLVRLVARYPARSLFVVEAIATIVGFALLLYALRRGAFELKVFVLFAFAVLALALVYPLAATPDHPQWEVLRVPGAGNRYYFLPTIAFLTVLLWIASNTTAPTLLRCVAGVLLLFLPCGIRRDWHYPPFVDFHFREYAARFDRAARGTRMDIPINPEYWSMELTKR